MKLEDTSRTELQSVDQLQSKSKACENKETSTTDDDGGKTRIDISSVASASAEMEHHNDWRIILYYCYIDMPEDVVDKHVNFQRDVCERNQLMGRIRVSTEGINGVLSGRLGACSDYEKCLKEELALLGPVGETSEELNGWELDVKYCSLRKDLPVSTQLFDSLIVKATSSVVSLFEPAISGDLGNTGDDKKKHGHSKQKNRRQRRQQQRRELQQEKHLLDNNLRELARQVSSFPGARHLSPEEWDQKLHEAKDAILLDCRNVYESNVGYFQAPSTTEAPTLLTNTRKYSDLPKILVQSKDQWAHKKQIFMYCTGGVRCEQASKFVQALVSDENGENAQKRDVEVYQLHGGIQRYLDHHFSQKSQSKEGEEVSEAADKKSEDRPAAEKGPCLYRGLNFVFDPRRTDPMFDSATCVGKCCLCRIQHDDYDNGHAPVENREARCYKCRILLLVCNDCRQNMQCWGEPEKEGLPKLYCGTDTCSDYQATGKNPVSIVATNEADNK